MAWVSAAGSALLAVGCAATLGGAGRWTEFTAPHGITLRAPADLRAEPVVGGPVLASYRCARYYFSISWESYDAPGAGDSAWSETPKREVELGGGYEGPWPYGAALHITWLRPGANTRPRASALPAGLGRTPLVRTTEGDYRALHFSAGCRTLRDREELLEIFRSVRFEPW